jgi:drug/metabolite transporter (DMT)-like permease
MTNSLDDTRFVQKKILQASLLVALSGILYGFLGYLGTHVLQEHFSISTMLFWRFLIASIWMYLFWLKKYFNHETSPINKRILFSMFILSAIGYASSSSFYFMASQYTGTGLAMVVFFSFPVMVALYSCFRRETALSFKTLFTLVAIVLGLLILRNTNNEHASVIGITLGILSAVGYAAYVIGSKYFSSSNVDSNALTISVCLGCTFMFLISSLSTHSFSIPHSWSTWIYVFALGILTTALPIQLMLEGLKSISSVRASILSVLEPLVTVFAGLLLLGETLTHWQMFGAFIILASAVIVQFQREL